MRRALLFKSGWAPSSCPKWDFSEPPPRGGGVMASGEHIFERLPGVRISVLKVAYGH